MTTEPKTATGVQVMQEDSTDRVQSLTLELVDQYFSPNMYGPHVRSRAGMLTTEALQKGFENGRKVAELAAEIPGQILKDLLEDRTQAILRIVESPELETEFPEEWEWFMSETGASSEELIARCIKKRFSGSEAKR